MYPIDTSNGLLGPESLVFHESFCCVPFIYIRPLRTVVYSWKIVFI